MNFSKLAKDNGLSGLKEVSRMTGTGYSTLHQWATTRPDLLHYLILGCAVTKQGKAGMLASSGPAEYTAPASAKTGPA